MTTHPLRRLVANAINRGRVCDCDELFVEALIALWQVMEWYESMLPVPVRQAWGRVKERAGMV